jgi:hypothetical protein
VVNASGTRLLSQIRLRGRTCLAWGLDMSGHSLWNLARKPDMSGLTGVFGDRIDFDVLHITNSPNEYPLDSTELLELK